MPKWREKINVNTEEPVEDEYDKRNDEWFKTNYLALIQDYPNMWIAVWDQRVVATATSRAQAESKAKGMMGDKPYAFYFVDPSNVEVGLS